MLPDPLEPGLQLDQLPAAQQAPTLLTDPTAALQVAGLRPVIDSYLQSGAPADLPQKVKERLALAASTNEATTAAAGAGGAAVAGEEAPRGGAEELEEEREEDVGRQDSKYDVEGRWMSRRVRVSKSTEREEG